MTGMNKRTTLSAFALAGILGAGAVAWDVAHPPQTRTIRSSYTIDVSDPEVLVGSAGELVVATVLDDGSTQSVDGAVYTDYGVEIDQVLKGDLDGTVTVRQLGGSDGETTFVLEDQPALKQGKTYVLVLNREPDRPQLTVVGGPLSARPLPPEHARREAVLRAWQTAVSNQKLAPN